MPEHRLRIDQVLPSFAARDAIGFHTLELQKLIRSQNIESQIYADEIKDEMREFARPVKELFRTKSDQSRYLIYQASTGSPVAAKLLERTEPLILNFHNITPREILGKWDPQVGIIVGAGVKQLGLFKDRISGAISVSSFNKWCLEQEGIKENSLVAAPFIPGYDKTPAPHSSKDSNTSSNWLFVGRIAPNKAQHDIIKAFSAYTTGWDPKATLTLVGAISSQIYFDTLIKLIEELNLTERVTLTGPIDASSLENLYQSATVFICLSDHEGFGFPIIEAMRHRLPVVAFASTAVTETVGEAGILLSNKDPIRCAAAVAMIENSLDLRKSLITKSKRQADKFSHQVSVKENLAALKSLIPHLAVAG